MTTNSVTLELPETLYHRLETLAAQEDLSPVDLIQRWTEDKTQAAKRFQDGIAELRALIKAQGGLDVGETKEKIVAQLRKTRQEIFEEEYAHLYR